MIVARPLASISCVWSRRLTHRCLRGFPDTHQLRGFQTPINSGVSRHPSTPGFPDTHQLRGFQTPINSGFPDHPSTPGFPDTHQLRGFQTLINSGVSRGFQTPINSGGFQTPIDSLRHVAGLDGAGTASGQAWGDSRASGSDHGAAGAQSLKLGGNRAAGSAGCYRRRVDRVRSSTQPRAARGAGSRARQRPRSPLYRPPPRQPVVNSLIRFRSLESV